jgi:hypothetical protein
MGWILFIMLNIHLVVGFLCSRMASDLHRNSEAWFLVGATLGVMGLALFLITSYRRPIPGIR